MDGWVRLGAALGGAPTGAYEDQLLRNYRTQREGYSRDKALEEATMLRNQRIAMEGIGQSLESAGLGGFTNLVQAGGGNAQQLSNAVLNLGEFNTRGQARGAALGGDLATANANLLSLANGPQALTRIQGDVAFNPLVGPEQQTYTTALGDARIAERAAAANRQGATAQKELALAGKYGAQAALGGFAPRTPKVAEVVDDDNGAAGATDALGTPPNTYTNPTDVVFIDPAAPVLPRGPMTRSDIKPITDNAERRLAIGAAQAAIDAGKDPAAVRERLRQFGIDPKVLDR